MRLWLFAFLFAACNDSKGGSSIDMAKGGGSCGRAGNPSANF